MLPNRLLPAIALLLAAAPILAPRADTAPTLEAVIAGPQRTPEFAARDVWRHPKETLRFFDVQPQHVVVEIWPGGAAGTRKSSRRICASRGCTSVPSSRSICPRPTITPARARPASGPSWRRIRRPTIAPWSACSGPRSG
jgi:predicted methyltransferase